MGAAQHGGMKRLLDAPHRIFFFAAAVQILLASAWWAATLGARAAGWAFAMPSGLPATNVHALLMIYGFFPLFIFGFLFTAGPRWLEQPGPGRGAYAIPALVSAGAAWLLLPALCVGAEVAAAVLLALILAWGWMLARFVRLIVASRVADRVHPILTVVALGFGIAGLAAARLWLLTGSAAWAGAMEALGLWFFLVPLFATVSHRMIPFFTANVVPYVTPWRPVWTLATLLEASVLHGALVIADAADWTWIVDLPAGVLAGYLAVRWGFAKSLRNRMLAMLHIAFAWMAAMWALHALQSLLVFNGVAALGLAPIHALSIGFLASLTLAMVSRVSCGHSG
ncbi:MAG TPA: NnrS family protein, partial [Usitatibacter sp.]|nr:NnrS family protein [Usitatibacter sp.]